MTLRKLSGGNLISIPTSRTPRLLPTRLFNKNFLLLWQGQAVSFIGDELFDIILILWIKELTDSATMTGLFLAMGGFVYMAVTPIAGTFADRYSRKKIIVWTDLLQGGAMISLALLVLFWPQNTQFILLCLFIVIIFGEALNSFFGPAMVAAVPDIVPKSKLEQANSMMDITHSVSLFFGQALGGTLFRIVGAPIIIFFNGISFVVSAFSEMFIEIPQTVSKKEGTYKEQMAAFRQEMMAGFRYVGQTAGLRQLIILMSVLNFFVAPGLVLLPFFVEDFLGVGPQWYGFLLAAAGVGAIIGAVLAGVVSLSGKAQARIILLSFFLQAIALGALGFVYSPWLAMLLLLISGMCEGVIGIKTTSLIQATTPSEMRGRVFGLLGTLTAAIMSIGFGLAGGVADLMDQNIPLVFLLSSGLATTMILIFAVRSDLHAFLSTVPSNEAANKDEEGVGQGSKNRD